MPYGFDPNQIQPPEQGGQNIFEQQAPDQYPQNENDIFGTQAQPGQGQPAQPQKSSLLDKIAETFGGPQDAYMAIGKTPKGEAYYGEGVGGWARKTFAKFFDPAKRNEGIDYARQEQITKDAQAAADAWAQNNPNMAQYKDYYQAIQEAGALNKERMTNGTSSALGIAAGEVQNVAKTALVDVGIMGILQAGDIGIRKLLAAGQGVDEIANTSANITKWEPFQKEYNWIRDNLPGGQQIADFSESFNPTSNSWNLFRYAQSQWEQGDYLQAQAAFGMTFVSMINPALGATAAKGIVGITEASPLKGKSDQALGIVSNDTAIMSRNLLGSNMIYTQMWDSQVKAEIMRDLEAGVPPTFVEEQYANPWVEMAGSLILDPLNVVGSGGGQTNKFLKNAQDITAITPEVKETLGALADASKALDAPTLSKTVTQVAETIGKKVESLDKLAGSYAATSLNASGKQFVTSRTVGGFLSFMVGQHVDDIDEAANFVRKMAEMATTKSDDVAKQSELLTYFAKARGGEQVFTEAGYASMAMFKKMLGEGGDLDKFVSGLAKATESATTAAEKTEALAAHCAEIIDNATREIFPTVDKIKKLDPEKYAQLPGYVKAINNFAGSGSLLGDAYKKANAMFAGIYMGLSPAFAIRNALANSVSIVADQGLEAGIKGGAAQLGNMFKPGALNQRNLADLEKALGALPRELVGEIETNASDVGATGKGFGGLYEKWSKSMANTANWSQNAEVAARTAIYRNAVVAEIDRGIRTALPGMDELGKAGFSEAQTNLLVDLIRKNRGNIRDAVTEFSERITKTGGVINATELVQPSEKLRGFLQKMNLDGLLDAARHGDYNTADEFKAATDDILDNLRKVSDLTDGEYARVAENSTEFKVIDGFMEGVKGELKQPLDTAFNHMAQTFRTAREAAYKAADNALGQVFDQARQAGDWATAQGVDAARSTLGDVMREPLGEQVANGLDAHRTLIRNIANQVRDGSMTADQALGRMKITFPSGKTFNGADVYDAADKFGDFVYQKYLPSLSGEWWGDFNHLQYTQVYDQLARLGADAENILAPAKEMMSEGFRLQDAIVQAKGNPQFINAALEGAENALQATQNAATGPITDILSKAQAQGWKGGAKSLLNAINKDAKEASKGLVKAVDQPLATDAAKGFEAVKSVPRSELPVPVSDALAQQAKQMLDEMLQAAPGKRTAEASWSSTYPDWYKEIYKQAGGREAVANGLEKIIQDAGIDKGKIVEKLKDAGLNLIWEGDTKLGSPPNLYVMQLTGANESMMSKALDTFNDITKGLYGRDLNLQEALAVDELNSIVSKAANADAQTLEALNRRVGELGDLIPQDVESVFQKFVDTANNIGEKLGGATGGNAGKQYAKIDDVPPEVLQAALKARGIDVTQAAETVTQTAQKARKPFVKSADAMHSLPGAIREQIDEVAKEFTKWQDNVMANWGKAEPGTALEKLDGAVLSKWADEAEKRMVQVRRVADEVGRAQGDFALHAYKDKTYIDNALAFIYPYHYWYGRTYKNWAQRLVTRPDVMAAYGKYRKMMETMHAGMPEFWKYNLSTNDLPGIDMENPIYFNLEATLNPLNGITGTDFTDSKKRVDWLSRTVDDMGKFGPSMFTPISWLMAAKLYKDGETDAANRWMGRLLPQSGPIKAAASLFGKNLEIDPFVNMFQGGLDPYERNRVGRALGGMVQDGMISEEQAIDAANQQSGQIWEQAMLRATQQRAPGQLAGFIGGVGFKGRNPSDIEIDNFYSDYYMLMGARANMPPDVYRQAMTEMNQKYPFADAVLISKRSDDDRMAAYAYNVIGRLPPGTSTEMLKASGLTQDMITKFYDNKGTFEGWTKADVQRFVSGIGDLGAMLALPDDATKQEWDTARNKYNGVTDAMKQQFGSDIMDKIDLYYSLEGAKRDAYIAAHPEIGDAFNLKNQYYATDPVLYKYYGGIEKLNSFYKSQMYTSLEMKYGQDISDKQDEYFALKDQGRTSEAKAFLKAHPELSGYWTDKKAYQAEIERAAVRVAANMPSGPEVTYRSDFTPQSSYQQDIMNASQNINGPQYTDAEWKAGLGGSLYRLVQDYWKNGDQLSANSEAQLEKAAAKMGYKDGAAALQAFGIYYYQNQQGGQP